MTKEGLHLQSFLTQIFSFPSLFLKFLSSMHTGKASESQLEILAPENIQWEHDLELYKAREKTGSHPSSCQTNPHLSPRRKLRPGPLPMRASSLSPEKAHGC
jgi:hypothetical protein